MITTKTNITDDQIRGLLDVAMKGRANAHKRATIKDAHAALRGDQCCREVCADRINMERFGRPIVRVDCSPMNAKRWAIELGCGHEIWVSADRKPKIATVVVCSNCASKSK